MARSDANDFREWELHREIPSEIMLSQGEIEKKFTFDDCSPGHFEGKFASFSTFHIAQVGIELPESATFLYETTGETIVLLFNILGGYEFKESGKNPQTLATGQQVIYYTSGHNDKHLILPENGHLKSLEINLPIPYYMNLLSGYSTKQDQFISKILSGKNSDEYLDPMPIPMTLPMKWLINTIQQCQRTGVLKRLFYEAKVLELLMLQIEQSELVVHAQSARINKPSDLNALHEAKSILEKTAVNPPTIRHLARMVGMNEFNLKKGFKEAFDTTIYGYVNGLKMQQAKQMILDGEKSIHEISSLSGYKNPQHFTIAFKKYFGQLPSKIKTLIPVAISIAEGAWL